MSRELVDLVNREKYEDLRRELTKDLAVNLLREGGELIKQALKKGNLKIIELFFDYFRDHQLSEYDDCFCIQATQLRNDMRFAIACGLDSIRNDTKAIEKLKPVLSKFYTSVLHSEYSFDEDDEGHQETGDALHIAHISDDSDDCTQIAEQLSDTHGNSGAVHSNWCTLVVGESDHS